MIKFDRLHPSGSFRLFRIDDLGVLIWGPTITDAGYEGHIEAMADSIAECGVPKAVAVYMPAKSPAPNAQQRALVKSSEDRVRMKEIDRVGLIAESAFMRGAFRAMSWLLGGKPEHRAFSPSEEDMYVAWLAQSAHFQAAELRACIEKGLATTQKGEQPAHA